MKRYVKEFAADRIKSLKLSAEALSDSKSPQTQMKISFYCIYPLYHK